MKSRGNFGFAVLLIGFGALILLSKIGFGLGHLMGYLIPIAMVVFGWISVQKGSRFFGWVLMVLGGFILLGKFIGIIGLIIAVGMIVYGITMLTKKS